MTREKSDKIIDKYDNKYHEVIASIPLRKFEETEVSELMYGMSGEEMDAEADRVKNEIINIMMKITLLVGILGYIGVNIYLILK